MVSCRLDIHLVFLVSAKLKTIILGYAVARITVEDCLNHIDNRFELSLAAATRARQLVAGHQPLVEDSKRDKPVVVALREIASGNIDRTILKRIGL